MRIEHLKTRWENIYIFLRSVTQFTIQVCVRVCVIAAKWDMHSAEITKECSLYIPWQNAYLGTTTKKHIEITSINCVNDIHDICRWYTHIFVCLLCLLRSGAMLMMSYGTHQHTHTYTLRIVDLNAVAWSCYAHFTLQCCVCVPGVWVGVWHVCVCVYARVWCTGTHTQAHRKHTSIYTHTLIGASVCVCVYVCHKNSKWPRRTRVWLDRCVDSTRSLARSIRGVQIIILFL